MLTPAIRAKRVVLLRLRFRSARTFFHNTAHKGRFDSPRKGKPASDSAAGRRALWAFVAIVLIFINVKTILNVTFGNKSALAWLRTVAVFWI